MSRRPKPKQPAGIALHRLPPQLRVLVRVMGEGPAFALVQARGGVPISVPKDVRSTVFEQLAAWCGSEHAAAALVREYAGLTLQLPKYDAVSRQLRHRSVVTRRQAGHRLAEIALATGYTLRQVINIIGAAEEDGALLGPDFAAQSGEGDLFGPEIDPEA